MTLSFLRVDALKKKNHFRHSVAAHSVLCQKKNRTFLVKNLILNIFLLNNFFGEKFLIMKIQAKKLILRTFKPSSPFSNRAKRGDF